MYLHSLQPIAVRLWMLNRLIDVSLDGYERGELMKGLDSHVVQNPSLESTGSPDQMKLPHGFRILICTTDAQHAKEILKYYLGCEGDVGIG